MILQENDVVTVETVRFESGSLVLEGELAYGTDECPPRGVAIIAGSHPLLGGNMHNNVVRCLGDGLAQRRIVTLRFNYRGVGRSEGHPIDVARHMAEFWATSHAPDEMNLAEDLQAASNFLAQTVGQTLPMALIGYSFGSALLPHVRPAITPSAHVLIAPPLGKHDYQAYESLTKPMLVIVSENDFTHDGDQLQQWYDRLQAPRQLEKATMDNHFFRGHEPWLVETVSAFLDEQWR